MDRCPYENPDGTCGLGEGSECPYREEAIIISLLAEVDAAEQRRESAQFN